MDVYLNSENAKSSTFSVQKTRSEIELNPKETGEVQRRWKLFIGGQSAAWEAFSPDRPKFLADSHFAPSDQGWGINLSKSANRLAAIRGLDGSMGRIWDSQTREAVWPNSWWCTFLTIKWGGDWGRLTVYILSSTFTSLLQDACCLLWANNFWTVVFSVKMKTKLLWSFLKEWTWGKTASSSDRKLPTFASIWMSLEISIWIRHLRFAICLYLDVTWDLQLYLYLHSKGSIYIHCVIVGWHILIIYYISRNNKHTKFQNYTNWK